MNDIVIPAPDSSAKPLTRIRMLRWLRRADVWAIVSLVMLACLMHARVVFLGEIPSGGDKTQFNFGLMSHYSQQIKQGRLPWWNENWGTGFAGVAESQIGAFYPIHLLLYYVFDPARAFALSYLVHRLLTGVSAYLAYRWMALRPAGAWLAGLDYLTGGFTVNHFDHQWAVESLPWLPWIVAGAFRLADKITLPRLLTIVLTLTCLLLVGHFQLAFITLVGASVLLLTRVLLKRTISIKQRLLRIAVWLVACGFGFGLAGVQLVPTAMWNDSVQMLRRASASDGPIIDNVSLDQQMASDREEYLRSFSMPPWLQASLLFPHLYQRDPLWRRVAWEPYNTSPEECLHYVGVIPLILALASLWKVRSSNNPTGRVPRHVRAWQLVWLVGFLLSLGLLFPLNKYLWTLPGFSFFRCSARYLVIQQLALMYLAGWSLDRITSVSSWRRLLIAALSLVLVIGLLTALFWWSMQSHARHKQAWLTMLEQLIVKVDPTLKGKVTESSSQIIATQTAQPLTLKKWNEIRSTRPTSLDREWSNVFRLEIVPTLVIVLSLAVGILASYLTTSSRVMMGLMLGLITFDLGYFAVLRGDRSAPADAFRNDARSSNEIVRAIAELPPASRCLIWSGNYSAHLKLASIEGYRTIDVPGASVPLLDSNSVRDIFLNPKMPVEERVALAQFFGLQGADLGGAITPTRNPTPTTLIRAPVRDLSAWFQQSNPKQPAAILLTDVEPKRFGIYPKEWPARHEVGRFSFLGGGYELVDLSFSQPVKVTPAMLSHPGKLEVVQSDVRRLVGVKLDAPGIVFISETYLPGWMVSVTPVSAETPAASSPPASLTNREQSKGLVPAERFANHWVSVSIDKPGTYDLEFRYHQPGQMNGLIITLASASLLYFTSFAVGCLTRRSSSSSTHGA